MKEETKIFILLRYIVLLLLMFSLPIIYFIATPATVYPVFFLLKIFVKISLTIDYNNLSNVLLTLGDRTLISIVPSCIAGSAYLLLLILNLTVPMKVKIRIYSILLSAFILLILNILRISIFSLLYHNNFQFFDFTHKFFWYVLSTIFVVGIWFLIVKVFKIEKIPVYSDLKSIYSKIKSKK